MSLRFVGMANVHWTEQHTTGSGKSRRTETRHYHAHEDYFNFDLMLFGSGKLLLNTFVSIHVQHQIFIKLTEHVFVNVDTMPLIE